jgi:hypothetical protein
MIGIARESTIFSAKTDLVESYKLIINNVGKYAALEIFYRLHRWKSIGKGGYASTISTIKHRAGVISSAKTDLIESFEVMQIYKGDYNVIELFQRYK